MAKLPPEDKFLGGGLAFNPVGHTPADPDPVAGDTGPLRVPSRPSPQGRRTLMIVVVLLVLAAVLYVVRDYGLGGVVQTQGHGISPTDRPTAPPKNF